MDPINRLRQYHEQTRELALALEERPLQNWLLRNGYFPESYVLPPCFTVVKHPQTGRPYFIVKENGKYKPERTECATIHFPKTRLTDRTFGIIDPLVHHDIVIALTSNWAQIVDAMLPAESDVVCYSFPIPIDSRHPGRLNKLRSGRAIYEYIRVAEDQLVSVAYEYSHIVKADIRNYYRSIYTHTIAWAIHGKDFVRAKHNLRDFSLIGNKLDSLFQNANDGCTNGIPIGPVVSDVIAEVLAAAVDLVFSKQLRKSKIRCQAVRFKDDYRILVQSESDAVEVVKHLQTALKTFNLELGEEKTTISSLPDGLFRPWVSMYHLALPRPRRSYTWKEFRELYLAVLRIDREYPGTGVIDRFLADIVTADGSLKVSLAGGQTENIISMLFMMARLRTKSFPKVLAILEALLPSSAKSQRHATIVAHLEDYLIALSRDEQRNKYLITWISYFITSNNLHGYLKRKPELRDPLTRMTFLNQNALFTDRADFGLFRDCIETRKKMTLHQYLDVFNPPDEDAPLSVSEVDDIPPAESALI